MRGRFSVSGGFGLLLALLLFLDGQNIVPWALLACALHELGHYFAIRALGGELASLRLTVVGAELRPRRARLFSYGEELRIVLAGPLCSLLAAFFCLFLARYDPTGNCYLFCGLNLLLGLFNLLPVTPLDGGRLTRIVVSHFFGEAAAERVCTRMALLFSALLLSLGVYLLRQGGNFTLILTALWLMGGRERNC